MAGGLTNYAAQQVLEGVAIPTTLFLKFHIGDPGADALLNAASHTTRKQLDFVPADLDFKTWNDAGASWPGITVNETANFFSLWDLVTGGNPWYVGEFAPAMSLVASSTATLDAHRVQIFSTVYGA